MSGTTFPEAPGRRDHAADSVAANDIAHTEAWRRARRRVRMQRGWFIHATVYAIVIGSMWFAWASGLHAPRFAWPLPPTLGWGLGLAIHGLVVLARSSGFANDWERRRVEAYVREELGPHGVSGK